MGYSIQMKINNTTLYTVYGHRLTVPAKKWNSYHYQTVSTPTDFYTEEPDGNRVCTSSIICEGTLKHKYDDGLLILCEKTLKMVNKQLKEKSIDN